MTNLLPKLLTVFFLLSLFSVVVAKPAQAAASLYLSPAGSTVSQGSTFSVSIRTNTGGAAVNAVQANLTYPADKLNFLGGSSGGSAFEITAEESGGGGSIRIGRGTVSPKSGDLSVATITFSAIPSSGSATVSFAGGSSVVSASTNKNISSGGSGATFNFSEAPPPPKPKKQDKTAPKISDVKSSNVTRSSATISWTTNEAADSIVTWGPTEKFGLSSSSTKLVKKHSVKLSGELLFPGATYNYKVTSKDKSGNKASSETMTFLIPGFKVQIKVTDKNGNPVEGAEVEIVGDGKGITDENGIATIENVPDGEQTAIIKFEGETLAEKITVADTEETQTFDAQFAGLSTSTSPIKGVSNSQFISLFVFIAAVVAAVALFRYRDKIFKKKKKKEED